MGYDVVFDSECNTFNTLVDLIGIFIFGKDLGSRLSTVVDVFKPFAKYGIDVPNSYKDGVWIGIDSDIGTVLGGIVFDNSVKSLHLLALIFLNDGRMHITGYNICKVYNIVDDASIGRVKVAYHGGDSVWLSIYPKDASGQGLRFSVRYYQ